MGAAHAPPSGHEPRDFRSRSRRSLRRSWRRINLPLALRGSQMNLFRRPSVRYGQTPAPETPYQRAAQVWDERIGSARVQATNWRLIAFGNLVLAAGLAAGLVWQSAQGTVVPWVVQVDKLGEAQAVAPAISDYKPADPQIAWHLARFIEQVRSVSADPVIVRQNWLGAYDFATDKGAAALNDYARTNDPFAKVGKVQVAEGGVRGADHARDFDRDLNFTDLGEGVIGAGVIVEGCCTLVGGEVIGAKPILPDNDGISGDGADLLDETREVPSDLWIGGLVVGDGRRDCLRFTELVDLNDPRHHGALRRLPDEPRSKSRRQEQIAEGDEAPIPGLHTSGTDALVPDLGSPLIGRFRRGCLAVSDGRTREEIHLRSSESETEAE